MRQDPRNAQEVDENRPTGVGEMMVLRSPGKTGRQAGGKCTSSLGERCCRLRVISAEFDTTRRKLCQLLFTYETSSLNEEDLDTSQTASKLVEEWWRLRPFTTHQHGARGARL